MIRILEAIGAVASGWIASLANALPHESVDLFNFGINGQSEKAFELYRWFLSLLLMDTTPNFVQLIKLYPPNWGLGTHLCVGDRGEDAAGNDLTLDFREPDLDLV